MGRSNRTARSRPNPPAIHVTPGPTNDKASTGPSPTLAEIERLETLRADIAETIKSGHELLRDLRIETRQARKLIPMIVAKRIKTEVDKQLGELADEVVKARKESVDKITAEFNRLGDIYLGRDSSAKRRGLRPLDVVVQDAIDAGLGEYRVEEIEGIGVPQEVHEEVQNGEASRTPPAFQRPSHPSRESDTRLG